jgi:hypothetical protein
VSRFSPQQGHTGVVTGDQLEMISTDPQVMHSQAVIAGTRVPVSVILDCLADGRGDHRRIPHGHRRGRTRSRRLRRRTGTRRAAPAAAVSVKFKLDENLPVSSAAILTGASHDVDPVTREGLIGAPDRDVVAAATAGRILVSLDRGLGDIRAYPPGSHAGIVVLRLTDQSAAAAAHDLGAGSDDRAQFAAVDQLGGAGLLVADEPRYLFDRDAADGHDAYGRMAQLPGNPVFAQARSSGVLVGCSGGIRA